MEDEVLEPGQLPDMPEPEEDHQPKIGKIFVGKLKHHINEQDLQEHFSQFGEIIDLIILPKHDQVARRFAYITFSTQKPAILCVKIGDHVIGTNVVTVEWPRPKKESRKDDNSNEKTGRRLFVGGLKDEMSVDDLKKHFGQFGDIVAADIIRDPNSNRSRGFGFVTFDTQEAFEQVLSARPHLISGHPVVTQIASSIHETSKGEKTDLTTRLFIGTLPPEASDDDIKEYFNMFGPVKNVEQICRKGTQRKRGFGYVEFFDSQTVEAIMRRGVHYIFDRKINVEKAQPPVQQLRKDRKARKRPVPRGSPNEFVGHHPTPPWVGPWNAIPSNNWVLGGIWNVPSPTCGLLGSNPCWNSPVEPQYWNKYQDPPCLMTPSSVWSTPVQTDSQQRSQPFVLGGLNLDGNNQMWQNVREALAQSGIEAHRSKEGGDVSMFI